MNAQRNNQVIYAAHTAVKAQNCPDCRGITSKGETSQAGEPLMVKAYVQG